MIHARVLDANDLRQSERVSSAAEHVAATRLCPTFYLSWLLPHPGKDDRKNGKG